MNFRWASALAVLVGIGFVLAGCSQSPLSPGDLAAIRGTSTPPPVVAFAPDGSLGYEWAPVGTGAGDARPAGSILPRSVSASSVIDGSRGGTVRAGRFSVKLAAGAFAGTANVTLSMADSTLMICDVSISPQSANGFRSPVQLTVDLASPGLTDAQNLTMFWYDPTKLLWVNLSAKSRVSGTTVTTSLDHFSKYAAGKAGW